MQRRAAAEGEHLRWLAGSAGWLVALMRLVPMRMRVRMLATLAVAVVVIHRHQRPRASCARHSSSWR